MKINLSLDQIIEALGRYAESLYPTGHATFVRILPEKGSVSAEITMREVRRPRPLNLTPSVEKSSTESGRSAFERLDGS